MAFLSYWLCLLPYRSFANFIRSHLSILDLTAQAIAVLFRNFSPVPISSRLFPMFSSISFSVSGFMWRSLIHLNLTLVQGDSTGSIRNLLHDNSQLCQHHLLKILSFFHWMVLLWLLHLKIWLKEKFSYLVGKHFPRATGVFTLCSLDCLVWS